MSDFFISQAELRACIATADAPVVYDVCRADKQAVGSPLGPIFKK